MSQTTEGQLTDNERTVLGVLEDREEGATFSELLETTGLPRTTFRRVLNGLQERGHVEKRGGAYHLRTAAEEGTEGPQEGGPGPEGVGEEGAGAFEGSAADAAARREAAEERFGALKREVAGLEVELGEASLGSDEDFARGVEPDFGAIRSAQERLVEKRLEAKRAEIEVELAAEGEAQARIRELEEEARGLGVEAEEKAKKSQELALEAGICSGRSHELRQIAVDLRLGSPRREQRRLDLRKQYAALVRGEVPPPASVRRDSKGRLIADAGADVELVSGSFGGLAG